jgi:hypothetical protein
MTLGRGMDVTNVIFCCPWNPESEVTLSKKMESKYEKMEVVFFSSRLLSRLFGSSLPYHCWQPRYRKLR